MDSPLRCRSGVALLVFLIAGQLRAEPLSLRTVVTPSTVVEKDGKTVKFAIHGYIEFESLTELFSYVESEQRRWQGKISEEEMQSLARGLLREGVESRVVSMEDERPLELLVTHTSAELLEAIAAVQERVPAGYAETFAAVQEKWKHSLNCWSASPATSGACAFKLVPD